MTAARKLVAISNMPAGPERDALKRLADEERAREWEAYMRKMTPLRRGQLLLAIAAEEAAIARGEQPDNPLKFNNGRKI